MSNKNILPSAIIIAALLVGSALVYRAPRPAASSSVVDVKRSQVNSNSRTVSLVDPGHILPVSLENEMAVRLVKAGVIDPAQLPQVTELNLLWALGLANKDGVLTEGPIMNSQYGGPTNMASVGGWAVSIGNVMDHYSMHEFMSLTPEEQALVEKVAKRTFRPCCKNSAYFPDCNHGMAMLGLLEYLASQGADEQALVVTATKANGIWFPGEQQSGCGLETQPVQEQSSCGLN